MLRGWIQVELNQNKWDAKLSTKIKKECKARFALLGVDSFEELFWLRCFTDSLW